MRLILPTYSSDLCTRVSTQHPCREFSAHDFRFAVLRRHKKHQFIRAELSLYQLLALLSDKRVKPQPLV